MAIKTMTNLEIYNHANALMSTFQEELTLPVKVNFYLQKNMTRIIDAGKEIEKARMDIIQKYGTPTEDGENIEIPNDKIEDVNNELNDLFKLEQEITVNEISLDAFDNIELTSSQVAAITFMIKDEEE
jgi:hypothetical protein